MEKLEEKFFSTLQEHSSIKLKLLESYIVPWMRKVILGVNGSCFICDTFAGTGYYEDSSKGSPIILIDEAIKCVMQLRTMNPKKIDRIVLVFVEKDTENFIMLKENIEKEINQSLIINEFNTLKQYPNIHIMISNNTHENFINVLVNSVDNLIPSLIFIDPFGYKPIPLASISKMLTKYKSCEVIINFMYEEINRFFLKNDSDTFNDTLEKFYGSNIDAIKELVKNASSLERRELIINGYKSNLKKSGAKFVLDIDIFKNSKVKMNIVFATKNPYGFDTMKNVAMEICGNIDYEFYSNGSQLSLFENIDYKKDMISKKISEYLYDKYQYRKVLLRKLKLDLIMHERFPSKYLRDSLKMLEVNGKINKVEKIDGTKRKPYTFPDSSIVYFN